MLSSFNLLSSSERQLNVTFIKFFAVQRYVKVSLPRQRYPNAANDLLFPSLDKGTRPSVIACTRESYAPGYDSMHRSAYEGWVMHLSVPRDVTRRGASCIDEEKALDSVAESVS